MSPDDPGVRTLVFDTGPLSHFARADLLDALEFVVGERRAVIPPAVEVELRQGVYLHSRLQAVLHAPWIGRRAIGEAELPVLAEFAGPLVSKGRNLGETEVLTLAKTLPAVAVIDDNVAYNVAKGAGVGCIRTLALLCDAGRAGRLTLAEVSDLADDLMTTHYRLPFGRGEFAKWANDNDQFPDQVAGATAPMPEQLQ